VLNDPLTLVDPLGATPQSDPYLVGCFPDPFFEALFSGFGCGWDASEPCPPGYEPIYGDPRSDRTGGPAIENLNSLYNYANAVLGGYADSITLGPNGVNVWLDADVFDLICAPCVVEGISIGTRVLILLRDLAMTGTLAQALYDLYNKYKATPKPSRGLPTGTKPIDQAGLTREQMHQIKKCIGAGPADWVGITPDGDVVTGTPDGDTINHGPWRACTNP